MLGRLPPQLHGLLQVRQDVRHDGLLRREDRRLHRQQQGPSQSPEPVGGPQCGEVLTDFFPVLVGEQRPAEEEEETWGEEERGRGGGVNFESW